MMTNPNPHERAAMPEAPIYTQRQCDERVEAARRLFRAALLEEAAQWTGDYRVPAHRALCDAAKRARVPLTMDDCYLAAKKA